jgi:hypothetical protein
LNEDSFKSFSDARIQFKIISTSTAHQAKTSSKAKTEAITGDAGKGDAAVNMEIAKGEFAIRQVLLAPGMRSTYVVPMISRIPLEGQGEGKEQIKTKDGKKKDGKKDESAKAKRDSSSE